MAAFSAIASIVYSLLQKPYLKARLRKELTWLFSSAERNPLHAGMAYRILDRTSASNTVLRWWRGRPWSRRSFRRYILWLHIFNTLPMWAWPLTSFKVIENGTDRYPVVLYYSNCTLTMSMSVPFPASESSCQISSKSIEQRPRYLIFNIMQAWLENVYLRPFLGEGYGASDALKQELPCLSFILLLLAYYCRHYAISARR